MDSKFKSSYQNFNFTKIETSVLKFLCNHKSLFKAKYILSKKSKLEAHSFWFKTILRSYSNQNSMLLTKKQTQINGTERLQQRKGNPFNKCWWKHLMLICKRIKLNPYLTPCTRALQNKLKFSMWDLQLWNSWKKP